MKSRQPWWKQHRYINQLSWNECIIIFLHYHCGKILGKKQKTLYIRIRNRVWKKKHHPGGTLLPSHPPSRNQRVGRWTLSCFLAWGTVLGCHGGFGEMVLFLGTFEDTGQPGEICLKEPVLIKRHVHFCGDHFKDGRMMFRRKLVTVDGDKSLEFLWKGFICMCICVYVLYISTGCMCGPYPLMFLHRLPPFFGWIKWGLKLGPFFDWAFEDEANGEKNDK